MILHNDIVQVNPLIVMFPILTVLGSIVGIVSEVQARDREYYGDEQNPRGHVEHGYSSPGGLEPSIDVGRLIGLMAIAVVVLGAAVIIYGRQRARG